MYHNSPSISRHDIDWNLEFFHACAQSRSELLKDISCTPIPKRILEKIDKAIENSGLTITNTEFLTKLRTDEVYQSQIMAHPSRQNFHENTQISKLNNTPGLYAEKAQGELQKIIINTNPSSKNWVDCFVSFTDSNGISRRAFGSMKFARIQGSHQSRQITDQKNFLLRCQEYISLGLANQTDLFFGAGDGDFFHPNGDNKNLDVSSVIDKQFSTQVFNGTTGQVIEWILSF